MVFVKTHSLRLFFDKEMCKAQKMQVGCKFLVSKRRKCDRINNGYALQRLILSTDKRNFKEL